MEKKNILIISPQPWGEMHISKHHYANALEKQGHQVYFLNPPSQKKLSIKKLSDNKNSYIVDYNFSNSLVLRYHARPLYDWQLKRWMRRIMKMLPRIDVVWCFETNIIGDLGMFKNMKRIFHVVDPIDKRMIACGRKTDAIVCVSDRILNQFDAIPVKKMFINHGLSDKAIERAKAIGIQSSFGKDKIQVGYIGNLFRNIIDTEAIFSIIKAHPEINFHFWGPNKTGANTLGNDGQSMVTSLEQFDNVTLYGTIPSDDIVEAINNMDAFLLAYKKAAGVYDSSNSHKIIEYWATGKIVISTYIDQYKEKAFEDFIQMTPEDSNDQLPSLFTNVINNLSHWNSIERLEKRKQYALEQNYTRNAARILELVYQDKK